MMQHLFRLTVLGLGLSLGVACQEVSPPILLATPTSTATPAPTATPSVTPTPDPAYDNGERLIARVNGQPIKLTTYQTQLQILSDYRSRHGLPIPSTLANEVLTGLITQTLLEQHAQTLAITVTEETLQTYLAEIDPSQLTTWQTLNHMVGSEFTTTLRFQLLANQLLAQQPNPISFEEWVTEQRRRAKIDLYPVTP